MEYLNFFWEISKRTNFLNSYSEDFSYLVEDRALEESLERSYWEKNCSDFHSEEFYELLVAFKNHLLEYDLYWEKNIKKGKDYYSENTTQVINDPQFLKVVHFCKGFLPAFENELVNNLYQALPPIIFPKLNRVYFSISEINYAQLSTELTQLEENKV